MITTQLMTLTPQICDNFLQGNTRNRPITVSHHQKLCRLIQRGEWRINGDTIRISKTGIVLDGQHRLIGIRDSGMEVQTLVVFGLDDEVFDTIDVGGKPRSVSDLLALAGEKNTSLLASVSRIAYLHATCDNPFSSTPTNYPTFVQLHQFLNANPALRESANVIASTIWVRKNVPPSAAAFCHHEFRKKYAVLCDVFFERLESGINLGAGSPVLLLRERMTAERGTNDPLPASYRTALVFKAFKHFIKGEPIKMLRVRLDGDSPEKDLYTL